MNAHVQRTNIVAQAFDRVLSRRLIHHQRGTGNDTFQVAQENSVGYATAKAKIIGIDDEPFRARALDGTGSARLDRRNILLA
jgi:hypothetical protein